MSPKAKESGHQFPVPQWWRLRATKIRNSMTDAAFIEKIHEATGREYTKFQITRYFQDERPTTTLELTRDIWLAFRATHALPRPFVIAATPEDAAMLDARLKSELDADVSNVSSDLRESPSAGQPPPIESPRATRQRTGVKVARSGAGSTRR